MARRTKEITIDAADSRDVGKTFLLTEKPAMQGEEWATRAFFALAKSGVTVPDDIVAQGLAGVMALGWQAFSGVSYHDAVPLLQDMLDCVQIKEKAITRKLTSDDVEEIGTLLLLRKEVFLLHGDFSQAAALLKSPTDGAPATDVSI